MDTDVTIDRIEDDFAICEDQNEKVYMIEVSRLPGGAKEGFVVTIHDDGSVVVNLAQTEQRRKVIEDLQKKLFKN